MKKIIFKIVIVYVFFLGCDQKNESKITIVFPSNYSTIATDTPVFLGNKPIGWVISYSKKNENYLAVDVKLDTTIYFPPQTKFILYQFEIYTRNKIVAKIPAPKPHLGKNEFEGTVKDTIAFNIDPEIQDSLKKALLSDTSFTRMLPAIEEILRNQLQTDIDIKKELQVDSLNKNKK